MPMLEKAPIMKAQEVASWVAREKAKLVNHSMSDLVELMFTCGQTTGKEDGEAQETRSTVADTAMIQAAAIREIIAERTNPAKNLMFLYYAPSPAVVLAAREAPVGTTFDVTAGTWSFDGQTYRLGQMRYRPYGQRYGTISVFDIANPAHWNAMLRTAREATAPATTIADD
jgi:hypothetical protein